MTTSETLSFSDAFGAALQAGEYTLKVTERTGKNFKGEVESGPLAGSSKWQVEGTVDGADITGAIGDRGRDRVSSFAQIARRREVERRTGDR